MTRYLKYVLLFFAVGFFAHSLWLYWFAYSTGSPFAEAVGPYYRASNSVMWAITCMLASVICIQHESLQKARGRTDPSG